MSLKTLLALTVCVATLAAATDASANRKDACLSKGGQWQYDKGHETWACFVPIAKARLSDGKLQTSQRVLTPEFESGSIFDRWGNLMPERKVAGSPR
jgi:hypothetical protein